MAETVKHLKACMTMMTRLGQRSVLVVVLIIAGLVIGWLDLYSDRSSHYEVTPSSRLSLSRTLNSYHLVDSVTVQDIENFQCDVSQTTMEYKSWKQGVVSYLEPVVQRNCSLLFAGDREEIDRVQQAVKEGSKLLIYTQDEQTFLNKLTDCSWIRDEFSNIYYTSQEEIDFPLAYVLVAHNNPQQIMRFLKAIYRPQNIYCIHVDAKSSDFFKLLIGLLANCLSNVFIPIKVEKVYWGHYSLLDAQLNCFSDLYDFHNIIPWKYALPLSGKELPLRTNREIVHMLKKLDGNTGVNLSRTLYDKKGPHNLTLYKSFIFSALTVEFVEFMLYNPIAVELREHLRIKKTFAPEEKFYATVYMLPENPKGYNKSVYHEVPYFTKYIWIHGIQKVFRLLSWHLICHGGSIVHDICVVGVEDMFRLEYRVNVSNPKGPMFHNKYFMSEDHVVMDCCEEELVKRNIEEFKRDYRDKCA